LAAIKPQHRYTGNVQAFWLVQLQRIASGYGYSGFMLGRSFTSSISTLTPERAGTANSGLFIGRLQGEQPLDPYPARWDRWGSPS
jgi:hypothetical protein